MQESTGDTCYAKNEIRKIKKHIRYNPNRWEDDKYYESKLHP